MCVCIGTQSVCIVSSVLSRRVCLDLHSILCAGCFVDAALADREGAHADVLLQHVAITEQHVLPMQLLQRDRDVEHTSHKPSNPIHSNPITRGLRSYPLHVGVHSKPVPGDLESLPGPLGVGQAGQTHLTPPPPASPWQQS